jgi:hypothetical protein
MTSGRRENTADFPQRLLKMNQAYTNRRAVAAFRAPGWSRVNPAPAALLPVLTRCPRHGQAAVLFYLFLILSARELQKVSSFLANAAWVSSKINRSA